MPHSPTPGHPALPATPPAQRLLAPIKRRSFFRYAGATAGATALVLAGCKKDDEPLARPTISAFTPTSGMAGTTVTVTGTHFTGATAVQLGSISTSFTVLSDTSLTFVVPAGAPSGTIVVGTPAGPVTTVDPFTVTTTAAAVVNVGTGDVGVLNYAYALEQLEAAFYAQVIKTPASDFTAAELAALKQVATHEAIHRDFFKAAINRDAPGQIIPDLSVNFTSIDFTKRASVLATAQAFEDTGVQAYNGAGALIKNPAYLVLAGKIVSVEARHAAYIRNLLYPGDVTNFAAGDSVVDSSSGLDKNPLKPSAVVAIIQKYVVQTLDASQLG